MAAPAHIPRENGKKGGRPNGSTTVPQFCNYVSDEERKKFVEFMRHANIRETSPTPSSIAPQ
jgi:hypothetical protein